MSLLSGPEIEHLYHTRRHEPDGSPALPFIDIDPWPEQGAGPNSVDLRLAPDLLVYRMEPATRTLWDGQEVRNMLVLDTRRQNHTLPILIPEEGFVLEPGRLYLGSTIEKTECHGLVPVINGRSSLGRLGMSVHVTAGFGDDGFGAGGGCTWTLEITVVHPLRVYAGDRVCQIAFHTLEGARRPYTGRYARQVGPVASRMHQPNGGQS